MPAAAPNIYDQFDDPQPTQTIAASSSTKEVNPFDQFDPPEVQAARAQQNKKIDPLRQVALQGRAIGEGVSSALTLPLTAMTALQNTPAYIANNVFGGKYPYRPFPSQGISAALNKAGAPNPETPGEQLGSAATRGVTGALTMSPAGIPAAIRSGMSGLTGASSSEIARQLGAPGWAQVGAGIVGGQVPLALEQTGANLFDLARPATAAGQQRLAGNLFNQQARNPQAAIQNLESSQPIVPGSMPTSGPASGDIGLLGLEKGLRGNSPAEFGERLSGQNTAQQAELSSMAGKPSDITAAEQARDAATKASRDAAFANAGSANVSPVISKINGLLASPIGKRDIPSQALTWLKGKLVDSKGDPETDPQNLYAVRQDINDAIAGKLGGEQSKFKLAQGQLIQMRNELDNTIEGAAPGFKAYLTQYGALSKPINRMQTLQDLQDHASLTAVDPMTKQPFLSPAKFSNKLDDIKTDPFSGLEPNDISRLEKIRADMQNQQAVNGPLMKAPGSDTFQNFAVNSKLLSPLNAVYKPFGVDKKVMELATEAGTNPQLAAALMRKANAPKWSDFSYRPGDIGTTMGIMAGTGPVSKRQQLLSEYLNKGSQ